MNTLHFFDNPYVFAMLNGINPAGYTWQFQIYMGIHFISFVVGIFILIRTLQSKPSKAQTAVVLFESGGMIYILGFMQEILSDTVEGVFISCITQYFGELLLFISALYFVSQLCNIKISPRVYYILTAISFALLMCLSSTRLTRLFYSHIGVNRSGLISRPNLTHSIGFFAFFLYILIISGFIAYFCLRSYLEASPLQKKRIQFVLLALLASWLPFIITLTGITGGYEIPGIGIAVAGVCLYFCFIRYGFFDSQIQAGSNAMEHCKEGIIVVDSKYHVKYQNQRIHDVFGYIRDESDMMNHPILRDVFKGERKTYENAGHIYEFSIEPLAEGNYILGYMLWVNDSTEHYLSMEKIQDAAIHDTLTGLYNRTYFQTLVEEDLNNKRIGVFIIFDMDNFKGVNDNYGHQCGDAVLLTFANVLKKYGEQRLYSCRLGGDEFCVFLRNVTKLGEVDMMLNKIFKSFDDGLAEKGYAGYTSLSAGAKVSTPDISFKALYSEADSQLYNAKTNGKHQFKISGI